MGLSKIDLINLYYSARAALQVCFLQDQERLSEEAGYSFEEITKTNEWVRIKFKGTDRKLFEIETRIVLRSKGGEELGYYCYHTDQNGDFVDDWLVFK